MSNVRKRGVPQGRGGGTGNKKPKGDDEPSSSFKWEEGKGRPHPLLIPHVIEAVITSLCGKMIDKNIKDFKNIRRVCSKWNQEGNRMYRETGKEMVFAEKSLGMDGNVCTPEETFHFFDLMLYRQFIFAANKTFDCPVNTIRFGTGFFTGKDTRRNGFVELRDFLSCPFLRWLRRWRIELCNGPKLGRLQERTYNDSRLEKLEELSFHCFKASDTIGTNQSMESATLFSILLGLAKNLKELSFMYPTPLPSSLPELKHQDTVFQRFTEIVSEKCPKTVEKLQLGVKLGKEQIQRLINLKMMLVSFRFDFRQSPVDSKILEDILNQQKDTLEELEFSDSERPGFGTAMELSFPKMEKLKWLKIQSPIKAKGEFSYSENFPSLKNLILSGEQKISDTWLGPSSTIRSFELFLNDEEASTILLLKNYFPKLSALHIRIDEEGKEQILPAIFTHMTDLEELDITFQFDPTQPSHNVDTIFTNLHYDDCVELRDHYDGTEMFHDEDWEESPSIADMKNLRRLGVRGWKARISRVTVILGFMKMPNLKEARMSRLYASATIIKKLEERNGLRVLPNRIEILENRDKKSETGSDVGEDDVDEEDEGWGWGDGDEVRDPDDINFDPNFDNSSDDDEEEQEVSSSEDDEEEQEDSSDE